MEGCHRRGCGDRANIGAGTEGFGGIGCSGAQEIGCCHWEAKRAGVWHGGVGCRGLWGQWLVQRSMEGWEALGDRASTGRAWRPGSTQQLF